MRIISSEKLQRESAKFPDVSGVVRSFIKVAKNNRWTSLVEVQQAYRDAEWVDKFTVFNLKGNKYRLIFLMDYKRQIMYFRGLMTHAEYDKGKWKKM